jgi:hypothetical protein
MSQLLSASGWELAWGWVWMSGLACPSEWAWESVWRLESRSGWESDSE